VINILIRLLRLLYCQFIGMTIGFFIDTYVLYSIKRNFLF